uniref:PH domain-containing protein n=1 Tax=Plectus sambesii TaxID=2011161 RepID=A0A914XBH7_9BILA
MASVSVTTVGSDEDEGKKQSLKMQKKEYRHEKKRVAKELITALKDPTVVVMADWLKVRGTLRKWTRFYCVLKPGILLVYKSPKTHKHGYWVGTVLLNTCELIERPSKKDGFCFKLFHPLDQSIWATRGPRGESLGAVTFQPLPTTYLICRAASEEAGQCWMDALELSLRCSGLLMRTMHKDPSSLSPSGGMSPFGRSTDSKYDSFNEASMMAVKDNADASSADDIHVDLDVLRKLTSGAVIDAISKPTVARNDLTETEAEKHFDAVSGLDEEDCGTESDTA